MEWKGSVSLKGRICSINAAGISGCEVYFEFEDGTSCAYIFDVDDRDNIVAVVSPGNFLDVVGPGAAASRPVMEAILMFHAARQVTLEFKQTD